LQNGIPGVRPSGSAPPDARRPNGRSFTQEVRAHVLLSDSRHDQR
jgi:hypothetical protein